MNAQLNKIEASNAAVVRDVNAQIMDAVRAMPEGGSYATDQVAFQALRDSMKIIESSQLIVTPTNTKPTFCTAATYQVFLKAISAELSEYYSAQELEAFLVKEQPDGVGIWGRWNANGPGVGCLFAEADLGVNFTDYTAAKPGDIMKIFWNGKVGKDEKGHLAIFFGSEVQNGVTYIEYWSGNVALENIPGGFSTREVRFIPKDDPDYGDLSVFGIRATIFSRIQNPATIQNMKTLPEKNDYLVRIATEASSLEEALKECGAVERP